MREMLTSRRNKYEVQYIVAKHRPVIKEKFSNENEWIRQRNKQKTVWQLK